MAYKFQLGPAVMSGSLTQEGGLIIKDDDGSQRLSVDRDSGQISGSGGMQIVGAAELGSNLAVSGTVKLDGVADATIDLAADSMYFLDSDGLMKREALSDYAVAIAGPGIGSVGGGIEVNVDDSSIEIDSDSLRVKALGITNGMLAGGIASSKLAELNNFDTGDLAEGSNLYFTDARARAAISEDADILDYDSSTGVLSVVAPAMTGSVRDIVGDAGSAAAVRAHFTGGEMVTITDGEVAIDAAVFSASADVRWDAKMAASDTDALAEGSSNLYWTVARGESMFDSKLAAADTGDLAEGSNLYFTDARARAAVSVTDAGGDGSLSYDNSTGVITYTGPSASEVRAHFSGGEMITITDGEVAIDASEFSASSDVRFDAKLAAADTDDLAEGSSNLYWTVARGESMFDSKLAAADTDDLSEGSSNLYWTVARGESMFDSKLAAADTGDLAEGSNLYFTDARARAAISETGDILDYDNSTGVLSVIAPAMTGSVRDIVGDAGSAAAVRAHFSGGEMIDIASGVVSINDSEFSGSWDDVLATKDTDDLAEGSNLYFTDARARQALSVTDAGGDGSLAYDSGTGVITFTGPSAAEVRAHFSGGEMITITDGEVAIDASEFSASSDVRFDAKLAAADTDDLSEGSSNLYWTVARGESMFDSKLAAADTDDLSEGSSNLYWTVARGESMFDSKLAAADTGDLAEGSNLYFTDARARAAISVTDAGGDGSLAYDNSTGVITYTGPSAAEVRAHFTAGDGLSVAAGDFSVNVDDSSIEIDSDTLRIKADGVVDAMLNDDVAAGLAGNGLSANGGVMGLDLNELTAVTVDVAADSIAIVDADDNSSKKESIADLVAAMAGSGLSASNGVLSTEAGVTQSFADANANLVEGMNFGTANLSADRTLTLPAAPQNGDVVRVKAPASLAGNDLIIQVNGSSSHLIDGQSSVVLESDGAAIALQYVGNNVWIVF